METKSILVMTIVLGYFPNVVQATLSDGLVLLRKSK